MAQDAARDRAPRRARLALAAVLVVRRLARRAEAPGAGRRDWLPVALAASITAYGSHADLRRVLVHPGHVPALRAARAGAVVLRRREAGV